MDFYKGIWVELRKVLLCYMSSLNPVFSSLTWGIASLVE